jgi:hypothetical protein
VRHQLTGRPRRSSQVNVIDRDDSTSRSSNAPKNIVLALWIGRVAPSSLMDPHDNALGSTVHPSDHALRLVDPSSRCRSPMESKKLCPFHPDRVRNPIHTTTRSGIQQARGSHVASQWGACLSSDAVGDPVDRDSSESSLRLDLAYGSPPYGWTIPPTAHLSELSPSNPVG